MFCNNMLQKEWESDVLLFITHVQACVATIRLLEIAWITRESRHKRELRHSLQKKFTLGR